jgi:acetolactate synthase-1/2/3 large subunit
MVRQLQDLFYDGVRVATAYSGNPDFVKLAEAYGIWAIRVSDPALVRDSIDRANAVDGPTLIDFEIAPEENVYPHLPAGGTASEMIEGPMESTGTIKKEAAAWLN